MLCHMKKSMINSHFTQFNNTPIHEAAQNGHGEIVKLFIPFTNESNAKDNEENTPFDLASGTIHK